MKKLLMICILMGLVTATTSTFAINEVLDDFEGPGGTARRKWFYQNDPNGATQERTGGFGNTIYDDTEDGQANLQVVVDPWDPTNHVLAWTFDGTQPNAVLPNGLSYFDLFLDMPDPNDWSAYGGIKIDIRVTSTGTMSDRDYTRFAFRLDEEGINPSLFDGGGKVWEGDRFDVLKNSDKWYTFMLYFDGVDRVETYVNGDHYYIEMSFENSIINRDLLESFRLYTLLKQPQWIGNDEIMTFYFDNVEFLSPPQMPEPTMSTPVSGGGWGPFLLHKNMLDARNGSSPGAFGDWEIGLKSEAGGPVPVISNSNYVWPDATDNFFTFTFTQATGTLDVTIGYAPPISYTYTDYAGIGTDRIYLMASSADPAYNTAITGLQLNGNSYDFVDLTASGLNTYASITEIENNDFTITGNINFDYIGTPGKTDLEVLIALGPSGETAQDPTTGTWTLVDNALIVNEGTVENPWVIKVKSQVEEPPSWGSVWFSPPVSMALDDIYELSSDYTMPTGTFGGGAPRFSVLLDLNDSGVYDEGDNWAFIYWGTSALGFNDDGTQGWPLTGGWYNTGNLCDSNDLSVDLGQCGVPGNKTFQEAKTIFGTKKVFKVKLVLDGSWQTDQELLVDFITVNGYVYDAYPVIPEWIVGDINKDGMVNVVDLSIMGFGWMRADCLLFSCDEADIAPPTLRDGVIDYIDYNALADNWYVGVEIDTYPPEPNIMTWQSEPNTLPGQAVITMTATTVTDSSGVEYFFKNLKDPMHSSGWRDSPVYTDAGLVPDAEYTYQVKARDKSPNKNETQYSLAASGITEGRPDGVEITDVFYSITGHDGRVWDDAGGLVDSGGNSIITGDTALRVGERYNGAMYSYRSIMSFDTSPMPEDSHVISVKLELVRGKVIGTNPFDSDPIDLNDGWGGKCLVDIASPVFGPDETLMLYDDGVTILSDYYADANAVAVAEFMAENGQNMPIVSTDFNEEAWQYINTDSTTQTRVYFENPISSAGDGSNYVGFYSGEVGKPAEGQPDFRPKLTVTYITRTPTMTLTSNGGQEDGRLWDDAGGNVASGASDPWAEDTDGKALRVGDVYNGAEYSYRSIISFDTSMIPPQYTINNVQLQLTYGGIEGTDPFDWPSNPRLLVDLASPFFGPDLTLMTSTFPDPVISDWYAPATATAVTEFMVTPVGKNTITSADFNADGRMNINLNGTTQFKIYFNVNTNGNSVADYLGFYSGKAVGTKKPKLIIKYSVE